MARCNTKVSKPSLVSIMNITIITVSYNSKDTIEHTFRSILNQDYANYEYIVVDGASDDGTLNIINKYQSEFQGRMRWISEKDKGLYDAMNKGIRLANGDIIGFLNSDDFFNFDNVLKKIVRKFEEDSSLDSVYADINYVKKNNPRKIVRRWTSGPRRSFKTGWHPAHPAFYVKREVYQKYGLFDTSFELAADFELMLRFLDRFKISTYYINKPFVNMRLGGVTNNSYRNFLKQNIECIRAFQKNNLSINFTYPIYRLLPKIYQYIH